MPNFLLNYRKRSHKLSLRLIVIAACLILWVQVGGSQTAHSPILHACDASTYKGDDAGAQINAAEADAKCNSVDASKFTKPAAAATIKALKPLLLGAYTLTTSGDPGIVFGGAYTFGRVSREKLHSYNNDFTDCRHHQAFSRSKFFICRGFDDSGGGRAYGRRGLHIQGGNSIFREILINPVWNGIALDVHGSPATTSSSQFRSAVA